MIPRPLRLALAPIRSAIVLARFVFLKTTSKTPFLIPRAFRSPPLAAPGAILEVESPQKVAIRIASRPPPASRPEEGEEMTQSAQCRGLRPTFPAYLRTLSMRIPSPLIRSGIRELLAQYPMAFLAHSLPLSTSPSSPTSRTVAERNCTLPKACLLDRLNARPSNVVSCLNLALWQLAVDGIRVSANLIIPRASGSFRPTSS